MDRTGQRGMLKLDNMSDSKSSSGGVGFAGLLTIAFIVLKLCKVIDWSWWWVISPILFSIGIALIVLGILGVYYVFNSCKEKRELEERNKKREKEIKEMRNRYDELSKNIAESKWEQRINKMHNQKTDN